MKSPNEYSQRLVELIERSAQIDTLLAKSRLIATDVEQELEELRAKQRETTSILHKLENSSPNAWENIGSGG